MAETRKDRRAPVSLKVRFKSATVDEFIEHYCKDVSRGGIFIKSSQPMAIGTLLKFQFQLQDESALIKGVGRVVWIRSPDDAVADQPAGMGIKFIKMDAESRATVDRIVDAHGAESGAYEDGRESASESERDSERPSAEGEGGGGESFFPSLPPAELPPPEDRTAVRQAAEFLAAALAEGSDEAAAREAEQKAQEARARTEQIEAERLAEAQRRAKEQVKASLPSMIIAPDLGGTEVASSAEDLPDTTPPPSAAAEMAPTDQLPTQSVRPPRPAPASATDQGAHLGSTLTEAALEQTPVTAPGEAATKSAKVSMPPASPKRGFLVPAAVLSGVVAVAAFVAMQSEPQEAKSPGGTLQTAAAPEAPAVGEAQETSQVGEAPSEAPAPSDEQAAAQPDEAVEGAEATDAAAPSEAEPAVAEAELAEPQPAAPMLTLAVRSTPNAVTFEVEGSDAGTTPVDVSLAEGSTATFSAKAPGYAALTKEVEVKKGLRLVKLNLTPLPYVIHVESDPPGAALAAGGKRAESPGDLPVVGTGAPKAKITVFARLDGYQVHRHAVAPADFVEEGDQMVANVKISLEPVPEPAARAPKPAAAPKPAPSTEAPKPAEPQAPVEAPKEEPPATAPEAPTPAPETPAPVPEAPPKSDQAAPTAPEQLPDNPFG